MNIIVSKSLRMRNDLIFKIFCTDVQKDTCRILVVHVKDVNA